MKTWTCNVRSMTASIGTNNGYSFPLLEVRKVSITKGEPNLTASEAQSTPSNNAERWSIVLLLTTAMPHGSNSFKNNAKLYLSCMCTNAAKLLWWSNDTLTNRIFSRVLGIFPSKRHNWTVLLSRLYYMTSFKRQNSHASTNPDWEPLQSGEEPFWYWLSMMQPY